jgi:hypothetical protein
MDLAGSVVRFSDVELVRTPAAENPRSAARGADADLVRDNNKRWKFSFLASACGLLLLGILIYVKLPGPSQKIVATIAAITIIGGLMLARWARAWDSIIYRPDPKGPLSPLK